MLIIPPPGSMHDLPQNLLKQIKDFEEYFTVDQAKLKQIVAHFVKELEKGKSGSADRPGCPRN